MCNRLKVAILSAMEGIVWEVKNLKVKRRIRFLCQRIWRGWDDSDTWSLDITVAKFVIPRLERFKRIGVPVGVPSIMRFKKGKECLSLEEASKRWEKILDSMIFAMKWIIWDKDDLSEEELLKIEPDKAKWSKKAKKGFKNFGKFFCCLWW